MHLHKWNVTYMYVITAAFLTPPGLADGGSSLTASLTAVWLVWLVCYIEEFVGQLLSIKTVDMVHVFPPDRCACWPGF